MKKVIRIPFIFPLSVHRYLLYAGQEPCPALRKTPLTYRYSEDMRSLTHVTFYHKEGYRLVTDLKKRR